MNLPLLHPKDQLVYILSRIYQKGMTTTSGGNLSIMDEKGDIWITPSGIDKGTLTRQDICRVTPNGHVDGPHKPSVELPFHAAIYRYRPDIRAIVHAHPPALVSFSLARVLPDTSLVAEMFYRVGHLTSAGYAVPGSRELGDNLTDAFIKGYFTVMMDNHGAVVGGEDLWQAFARFETLETAATLEINARKIGRPQGLTEDEMRRAATRHHLTMEDFAPHKPTPEECEARRELAQFIRRSYRQGLIAGTLGDFSIRLPGGHFVITPQGGDRANMEEPDMVLVKYGMKEKDKTPSPSVLLHQRLYDKHPHIQAIVNAVPPHAMAFAVTEKDFDPRTIPESYIMLRSVKKAPFSAFYQNTDELVNLFSPQTPVVIGQNNAVVATGGSLLQAFDRLEVAEATARSIIAAQWVGPLHTISEAETAEIDKAFPLS